MAFTLADVNKDLPATIYLTAHDDKGNPVPLTRYMAERDKESGEYPTSNVLELTPKVFSSGSVGYMAQGQENTKGAILGAKANLPGSVKHDGSDVKFQISVMFIVIGSKDVNS